MTAPVAPRELILSQPDGTEFKAMQRGDEWQHWIETEDGYTVTKDNETGWWYYAEPDNDKGMRKGLYQVGKIKPEEESIVKNLRPKRQKPSKF
ncbi:MAG: hypothetical protein HZC44_12065 [Geobacter sp.]|nr:hypothetical protein [Geobacter sp.]